MKISVLVAQYFYQHRVLNLPGIGSFYLDDVVDLQSIGDRSSRDVIEHIHFAQKNIARPDDELIDFIRKHTGKIKPLAESDLDTFVADGKLMLNIGKPFHIEGIGTLYKNKEGIYEFTPGQPVVQRLESPPPISPLERDNEMPKKRSVFDDDPNETRNASIRRAAIGIGGVIGIGIILWGGYSLFSKKVKTDTNTVTATTVSNEEDTSQGRTSQYLQNINDPKKALENVIKKDSLIIAEANTVDSGTKTRATQAPAATTPVATGPSKTYKFILQTTKFKTTAVSMYNKLKPRVILETADSTLFKIVINVPGTPADTTRIKDSLRYWYWGPRNDRQVTIEQ
ncbi:MAG TPA: hypothetical protein VF008_19870 [Niastella sp.]